MEDAEDSSAGELVWPQRWLGRLLTLMTLLLAASLVVNILLAHRLKRVTDIRAARISDLRLEVGTNVPSIAAKRLGGQQEQISYKDTNKITVLYIFTPACSWCARNMGNFKTLLEKESGEYRFIALSLSADGVAEYVAKNELKLPVYSGLSPETVKAYKLGTTPQTIVVSSEGKVLQDWAGAWVKDQKTQVEGFFHVGLPGLTSVPQPISATNPGN